GGEQPGGGLGVALIDALGGLGAIGGWVDGSAHRLVGEDLLVDERDQREGDAPGRHVRQVQTLGVDRRKSGDVEGEGVVDLARGDGPGQGGGVGDEGDLDALVGAGDRKSTRLNSSHVSISYAVFCLKKKTKTQ